MDGIPLLTFYIQDFRESKSVQLWQFCSTERKRYWIYFRNKTPPHFRNWPSPQHSLAFSYEPTKSHSNDDENYRSSGPPGPLCRVARPRSSRPRRGDLFVQALRCHSVLRSSRSRRQPSSTQRVSTNLVAKQEAVIVLPLQNSHVCFITLSTVPALDMRDRAFRQCEPVEVCVLYSLVSSSI